jgi:hypothetical protein
MLAFGIKETTTTTGTGNLTLAGVTGFPRCNDAFPYTGGRRFEYAILDDTTGAPLENGIGYLTTNANTLVREKVLATFVSSTYDDIAPVAVTLAAGTKRVICTQGMGTAHIGAPNIDSASTAQQPRRVALDPYMDVTSATSSGFTLAADDLYLMPIYVAAAIECSGIVVRVGTGVSAKSVRLGLYDLGSAGFPTRLLGETGALAAATSGVDVSGSFASNVRLSPGWYCIGMVSDGAIAVGTVTCNSASFMGATSGNLIVVVLHRHINYTFGALPNPPTTATNAVSATSGLRVVFGLTAV